MTKLTKEQATKVAKEQLAKKEIDPTSPQPAAESAAEPKGYIRKPLDKEILLDPRDIDIILNAISKFVVFNLAQPLIEKISLQAVAAFQKQG